MMTLDLKKFRDKIGDCLGPGGVYRGLYEFSQKELGFFEEELL